MELTDVPGTQLITDFIEYDTERIAVDGIRLPKKVFNTFPKVKALEIYKSKRVSSILFDLFPNLEKLVVRYGVLVGETPKTLPLLKELHLESSPWKTPLEVAPNLKKLSLRKLPEPLEIIGDSLDGFWAFLSDTQLTITLNRCGELNFYGGDIDDDLLRPQSVITIEEIDLLVPRMMSEDKIVFHVERVKHLVLEHVPQYVFSHPLKGHFGFIETLSVTVDSRDDYLNYEELPVENLVVISHHRDIRVGKTPLLKRLVLKSAPKYGWGSEGPPQYDLLSVSVPKKKGVVLILDIPREELERISFKLKGVSRIVVNRILPKPLLEEMREKTGLEVVSKTRGGSSDEDLEWYSTLQTTFIDFPGNGNKF